MDDWTAAFIIGCKTQEPVKKLPDDRFVSHYRVIRTMTIWIELPATCDQRVVSWAIWQSRPHLATHAIDPSRWSLITNPRTSTAIVSQWKMLLKWQVMIRKIQNTPLKTLSQTVALITFLGDRSKNRSGGALDLMNRCKCVILLGSL